jgi:hypothetical protein
LAAARASCRSFFHTYKERNTHVTKKSKTRKLGVFADAVARHGAADVLAAINLLIDERRGGHLGVTPFETLCQVRWCIMQHFGGGAHDRHP